MRRPPTPSLVHPHGWRCKLLLKRTRVGDCKRAGLMVHPGNIVLHHRPTLYSTLHSTLPACRGLGCSFACSDCRPGVDVNGPEWDHVNTVIQWAGGQAALYWDQISSVTLDSNLGTMWTYNCPCLCHLNHCPCRLIPAGMKRRPPGLCVQHVMW